MNRSFLISQISSPHLTVQDASLLLLYSNNTRFNQTDQATLFSSIRGTDWQWIQTDDLFITMLRLLAIYTHKSSVVDGECLGLLANRLIADEIETGGPYRSDPRHTTLATNIAIAELFHRFDSPMPNVEQYIQQTLDDQYSINEGKGEWIILLFHQFTPKLIRKKYDHVHFDTLSPIIQEYLSKHTAAAPSDSILANSISTNNITAQIKKDIHKLNVEVRPIAIDLWKSIVKADKRHEISLLSHYFAASLIHTPTNITERFVKQLGAANIYTWIAYSTYDNFIDDDAHPRHLSAANIMHRKAYSSYTAASHGVQSAQLLVENGFDGMDIANQWELNNCRYRVAGGTISIGKIPLYRSRYILARRARGHILGPLLITAIIPGVSSHQRRAIDSGLTHYLIARQINDDLHDWKDDLSQGHISYVVAHLLASLRIQPGEYTLVDITTQLQEYFWKQGLQEICTVILDHTKASYDYFLKSKLLTSDTVFFDITINSIEQSARKSIAVRNDQELFLQTYRDRQL